MTDYQSEDLLKGLRDIWSLTNFGQPGISEYAEQLIFLDTRRGVFLLSVVTMLMLATAAVLYSVLEFDSVYFYTCALLAILSLHMAISSRTVQETRVLYLLGITLLVVNGVAFVLLAHQAREFDSWLVGSVILLFLVMPLVPWGLREGLLIVLLVYLVFTVSTLSVDGRFTHDTLLMLQYVMLGSGLTTLIVIGRNIGVRKHEITTRYELEKARHRMELLALKDPLTGAWNRRFLEQEFTPIVSEYQKSGLPFHFAIIDIDAFKLLNDRKGHDYGDLVLRRLVANFLMGFSDNEHLVRTGGDEFALLSTNAQPEKMIAGTASALKSDPQLDTASAEGQVSISVGMVTVSPEESVSLDSVYRKADEALYRVKARSGRQVGQSGLDRQAFAG